jgi:DNA-binding MarR family transcriptional regulator
MEKHEEILLALRQIIQAIDLYSRKLNKDVGLTGPQLMLMRTLSKSDEITIKQLAKDTQITQATATTILDKLEQRHLVQRQRSQIDKRKVHAHLTETGSALLEKAPQSLQEGFITEFVQLEEWEKSLLLSSVQRIAAMMNAEKLLPAATLTTLVDISTQTELAKDPD